MAPRNQIEPPARTDPKSKQNPQSLKVVLKVRVVDQDLISGRYRQVPVPAIPRIKRKYTRRSTLSVQPTSAQRVKRRRIAKDLDNRRDSVTVDERITQLDDLEADEQEEEELWRRQHYPGGRLRWPSMSDFQHVSDLSFPLLVSGHPRKISVVQETQKTAETKPVGARPGDAAHCGDCGIPASSYDTGVLVGRGDDDIVSLPTVALASPNTSPSVWAYLASRRSRHIDRRVNIVDDLIVTRSAPVPQTVGFWYDVTIAEQARCSDNLDFKMLCLNLIRWRIGNCCESETIALRTNRGCDSGSSNYCWKMGWEWDLVLTDAVVKGKTWRKRRRLLGRECEKAAGWAVWEGRQRRGSRGDFAEDQNGAWVLRAPGLDGEVRKVLCLGYKRGGESESPGNDFCDERYDDKMRL